MIPSQKNVCIASVLFCTIKYLNPIQRVCMFPFMSILPGERIRETNLARIRVVQEVRFFMLHTTKK